MTAPRFDSATDHGMISPAYDGAGLQQGDHFFAANGDYLFSEKDGKRWTAAASKAGAPVPARDAPQENSGDKGELDLAAWVREEVKYPFFKLRKAAAEAVPDIDTQNMATIRAGLLGAGIGA